MPGTRRDNGKGWGRSFNRLINEVIGWADYAYPLNSNGIASSEITQRRLVWLISNIARLSDTDQITINTICLLGRKHFPTYEEAYAFCTDRHDEFVPLDLAGMCDLAQHLRDGLERHYESAMMLDRLDRGC